MKIFISIICIIVIVIVFSTMWNTEHSHDMIFITKDEAQADLFIEIIQKNNTEKYSIKQKIKQDNLVIIEYKVIQDNVLLSEYGKFKTNDEKTYKKFIKILNDNSYKVKDSAYDYEKEIFIVNYDYKEVEY